MGRFPIAAAVHDYSDELQRIVAGRTVARTPR